jgi:phage/plasmid-associated DNA primase
MHADPLDQLADLNRPGALRAERKMVVIGSDVEIAGRVRDDLQRAYGEVWHAEGYFWRYGQSHWVTIPEHELRLAVHDYDGASFRTPSGEPSRVKLSKSRVDSVLNELAALVAQPFSFESTATGINCASGFIRFGDDGAADLEPHDPDHRCRHTLPGRWSPGIGGNPPEGSLLARLLGGVFLGDDDAEPKVALLAEIVGAAALGYATRLRQPRAVILKGETAENGKSQVLDLVRHRIPPHPGGPVLPWHDRAPLHSAGDVPVTHWCRKNDALMRANPLIVLR